MREVRRLLSHLRYVHLAFLRNPAAAIFTLAFPLGLLVALTTVLGDGTVARDGVVYDRTTYHVVAMALFGLISATYTNVAMTLTLARERGVLKRLRGTPLPLGTAVAARIVHATVVALALVAVTFGYGLLVGAVDGRSLGRVGLLLAVSVIAAASFAAMGIGVSTCIRDAASAPPVVNGLLFPVLLLSGVFVPIGDDAPAWVRAVADVFPIQPAFDLLLPASVAATSIDVADLAVLTAWGAAGAVVAMRRFRWEPAA